MSSEAPQDIIGVAEAKARFSELIDRVGRGERILISRRGKPAVALVPAREVEKSRPAPRGLLAGVGALADWEDLPEVVEEIYAARRRARDRPPPELD